MKHRRTFQQSLPGLGRIIRTFWPEIRKQRLLMAGSFLALLAEVGLRALEPWPLKFIFDRVFSSKHAGKFASVPFLDTLSPLTLLAASALAIILFTGLRALAEYANTIGFAKIGSRILTQVRAQVFRHLQGLSLAFHTRARSGDLILRVMSDINMLKDVIVTAALPLLADALVLLVMVVLMFCLQWKLALMAMVVLPLFWLSTVSLTRRIQQAARNQRHRESAMAASAAESISAIHIVQALCLEGLFADSFCRRNSESQKQDVKGARLMAALGRTVGFLTAISTALVLWYGGSLVFHEKLSTGDLLVFLAYLRAATKPLQEFAKYTGRLAKATAAGERVLDLLDRTAEVRDLPGAFVASPFQGAVRFEAVSFAYVKKRPVLTDITFEVRPGQHVALVGPSGIGKSTILSLLLRLYDPLGGRVLIDDRDIRDYTLASLRSQISVVLQDSVLFAASVRDNIAYGCPQASAEEIEAAARLANAHEFIQAMSQGYETIVGERGVTLSGGQRQRIAIARAAIRKAPILLLDEPTTGLDEENQRMVLEALERLAQGRTTLLVSHDLQTAARADWILYLGHGQMLEAGSHADLIRANGRYAALFRLQAANLDRLHPAGIQNGNGEQTGNGFGPFPAITPIEKTQTVKDQMTHGQSDA
jgi:ATP-binding cassette, subfamily B, bacterial